MVSGCEWIVEAHSCLPSHLADAARLRALFDHLVLCMDLHPIEAATWHQFPVTGGITGLSLLSESHIACHTFPEYGSLCLNVFCCRSRADADFQGYLKEQFGAAAVQVRRIERPYGVE
jgi:S-adenosylmethionine decarboxylase